MKERFHLDAFSVHYEQPQKSGVYLCIYRDGQHNIGHYDADKKTWSGDVYMWIHPTPVNFSDSDIVERAGFRSKFRQIEQVMFEDRGVTFYGWISGINFPDENTPIYSIDVVVAWKGEPFESEPITFTLPDIDPDEVEIKKSDRKIP